MNNNDDKKPCAECSGRGQMVGYQGYRITGPGYGDAEPREKLMDCPHCDGRGYVIQDESDDSEEDTDAAT